MTLRRTARSPTDLPPRLENAIDIVCRDHSFHAGLLARAQFERDDAVEVMGVTLSGGDLLFVYCERAMRRIRPRAIAATLLHEIGHAVLFHVGQPRGSFEHPLARLVAEEVSANEFVRNYPFPGRPVLLADYGLPEGESTDTRYRELVEMGLDGSGSISTVDDHRVWRRGSGPTALERAAWLATLMDAWESAEGWDRFAIPTGALEGLGARMRGDRPGTAVEVADPSDLGGADGRIRAALDSLLGSRCELRESSSRPSRRAPPGVGSYPALVVRPREPRLSLILDTSGSTARFAGEMAQLLEMAACWADVTVIQCDCQVQSIESLRSPMPPLRGRGGSDLRPAFQEVPRLGAEALVVVTDLDTRLPNRPPAIPVLFVLTPDAPPAPWGRSIRMARRAV